MNTHPITPEPKPVQSLAHLERQFPEYFPLFGIDDEPDEPNKSGDLLNQLFDRYRLFRTDAAVHDLFREIGDYARRSALKESFSEGWKSVAQHLDDIVQESLKDVWRGLETFKGDSRFSSWVYQIVKNNTVDAVRSTARLNEVKYLEWRANSQEYSGTQNAGNTGAAAKSGNANDAFSRRILNCPLSEEPEDEGGHGRRPLLPRPFLEESETHCNKRIDLQLAFRRFKPADREVATLFFCYGYSALEIAQNLGKDIIRLPGKCSRGERWVQNRLVAIRRILVAERLTVPQVRPTGIEDIERAYISLNRSAAIGIEFENAVRITALRRLTRPFKPDQDDGFSIGSEPNKGRSIFFFAKDQRTDGSRGQEVTTSEKLLAQPSNLPGSKRLSIGESVSSAVITNEAILPPQLGSIRVLGREVGPPTEQAA